MCTWWWFRGATCKRFQKPRAVGSRLFWPFFLASKRARNTRILPPFPLLALLSGLMLVLVISWRINVQATSFRSSPCRRLFVSGARRAGDVCAFSGELVLFFFSFSVPLFCEFLRRNSLFPYCCVKKPERVLAPSKNLRCTPVAGCRTCLPVIFSLCHIPVRVF